MMDSSPGDLLTMEGLFGARGGGTSDYTALRNLPTINGETVTGDLSGADLHLATLDSSGLVPAEILPSYVDDVLEYDSALDFPAEGETGKIYLAKNTSTQYRWSGTQYVVITRYIPPATNAPQMDGTAAVGSAEAYAREDHVHPTDTSRASTAVATTSTNGLMTGADKEKLDGIVLPAGGISMPVILANQSIAAFDSAAAGRPLRVTAHIEPVQASGTPSPENPLPITGWTGATVMRTGKNLLKPPTSSKTDSGITWTVHNDGGISATGTATAQSRIYFSTYTFNFDTTLTFEGVTASGVIGWAANANIRSGNDKNVPANTSYGPTFLYVEKNTTVDNVMVYPMIRRASDTDPTFEPYQGQIVTVQLTDGANPLTVYGAMLDLAQGLLTVTHVLWERNTSTMNNNEAYPGWSPSGISSLVGNLSNKQVSVKTNLGNQAILLANGDIAFFKTPTKTQSEWKSLALDYQAVIALTTPRTYQLTPQQIVTLAGTNNVFADCGPVTVTHWPGTGTPVEPVDMAADVAEARVRANFEARLSALENQS